MPNQSLARGIVLAGIALAFGAGALQMPIGQFSRAGPGLFPLLVNGLLLVLAAIIVVKSFLTEPVPLSLNLKNIAIVLAALAGFVVCSRLLNIAAGTVWLVFVSTLAGTSYSWIRNLKVSVGLIIIAVVFEKFLGLNLGLL